MLAGFIFAAYPDNPIRQYWVLGLVCSLISIIALLWCTLRIQERGAQPLLNRQQQKRLGLVLIGIGTLAVVYGLLLLIPLTADWLGAGENNLTSVLSILLGLETAVFGITLVKNKTEPHLCDHQAVLDRSTANSIPTISIFQQLKIAFSNRPFLYIIGIYLCSWLAVQLTASILIYFVVSWMGISEQAFTLVAIAVQGTALVMLFFWKVVSEKLGKKAVYFLGTIIWIIAQGGLFLLQPGQIGLMYVLAVMAGFGVSVAYLIPWSMIPDAIELDELNTGQRREGVFYSFMVLLQKFGLALALLIVGYALELAGFIEQTPGEAIPVQPESALLAIRIAVGPLPTVVLIIGLILAYFYPITREVHAQIRLKLQQRKTNANPQ
jgi:GPH family glycoside/pentoside/hexuronide:cation symporter